MKVKELIEKLQTMPQDMEVVYRAYCDDEQTISSVHHIIDSGAMWVDTIGNNVILKPYHIEKVVIGDM